MPARPFVLHEASYRQLREHRPNVAVLPWGATEAHNYHLPHGTDVIEAVAVAERAAEIAHEAGARVVVLPAVPYGNNAQQLDQVATISLRTATALAVQRLSWELSPERGTPGALPALALASAPNLSSAAALT